jgi:hypothetical protein
MLSTPARPEMTEPEIAESNGAEGAELQWTVRLYRRNPEKLVVIWAVAIVAAVAGFFYFKGNLLGALVGFLMIALSTTDFWLPLHFRLDGTGAHLRCGISVTSIEWEAVKRTYEVDNGIKLTPLATPSRLEPFRGVRLRFDGNREEVLAAVRNLGGLDV